MINHPDHVVNLSIAEEDLIEREFQINDDDMAIVMNLFLEHTLQSIKELILKNPI